MFNGKKIGKKLLFLGRLIFKVYRGQKVLNAASLAKAMRRVDDWKMKLIDLSRRNRLVYFRPTRSSNLEFSRPGMDAIFERLVIKDRHWEIWQPPSDDQPNSGRKKKPKRTQVVPAETEPAQLERILRNLARRSASEYRERGTRILYVTFGMLDWTEAKNRQPVRSPIVLTPVEITRKSSRDLYRIEVPAVEDEAILNPALRLMLENDHKLSLPPLPDFDEQGIYQYLEVVQKAVESLGWNVDLRVQMGLFSFHKLVMYQDLNENAEIIAKHPVVSALAGVAPPPIVKNGLPSEGDLDTVVDPKSTFQVLDADSSQQLCIQYALNGQSFVMHGPPGTGKSQTIANMISEFIAHGKSVLFVSEKMAALEVVYNRLRARNLDDFCLELHSHKANKREVVAELKRSLDEHIRTRKGLTDEELDRLIMRRNQLNIYVSALHRVRSPIDLSAFQLLGRLARVEESPFIPSEYPHLEGLDQRRFFQLEESFRRLANSWAVVEEGDGFPWKGCRETRFTPETRSDWISKLDGALTIIQSIEKDTRDYTEALGLPTPSAQEEFERLQRLSEIIDATPRPPSTWFDDVDLKAMRKRAQEHRGDWERYWTSRRGLERHYDSRLLALPMGTAERVEAEWSSLKELLARTRKGDGGLLKQMGELGDHVRRLPGDVWRWKSDAEQLKDLLGLKGDVETIEKVRQIADLAKLCEEGNRPERAWLDAHRMREAKGLLESLKAAHDRRAELRETLKEYSEDILTLDLDGLITFFEGSGGSVFRHLMPSYYSMRGTVAKTRRDGSIPESILDDLRAVKELVDLERGLTEGREDARKLLRSYFNGAEPEFNSAQKALGIAESALRLMGRSRAPKELRDSLVVGTKPSEELLSVSRRLSDSLSPWINRSRRLTRLVPQRRMPSTGKPMQRSSLEEVADWARQVDERLSSLSRVSAEALATRRGEHPGGFDELIKDLKRVEELQRFEARVEELSPSLRSHFGGLYRGILTDWGSVLGAVDWTEGLLRVLTDGVSGQLKRAVSEGGPALPAVPRVGERMEQLDGHVAELNSRFDSPLWPERRRRPALGDVHARVRELRDRLDDLQTWVDYNDMNAALREAGFGKFLDETLEQGVPRDQLVKVFQKAMYQGLLDRVFDVDPALSTFRGKDHEQLISDFGKLDRKFIKLSASRVIENANEQKPTGVFVQAPDSEITILMREAAKKRRHMPLRHLFERIPNLIRRLKPCLMMSPISVSQFLIPGGLHFDLVVFDEASQIYSEDAVGSIYRGSQLVVAGDPKQLPPTPFFRYTVNEDFDWDEDKYEFDVFDSVLDECMSIGLPVKMLRWHYRSKHDSLISFSNDRFYDGRLVLFPASRMGAEDLGLEFVHVKDGVYDRGGRRNNVREAEVVTDLVFDHIARHPEKTLGVVTFSIAQMNTVQDTVEERLRDRPEFEDFFQEDRLNGFFVKNLENVQGDERDVMIFSVGYGYDGNGRITMNFGPLNKQGGERRLNVAVTRAREKVILVSSIRHGDIKIDSTRAQGVHALHHYLRYAERRPKELEAGKPTDVGYASALEEDVAEEVERLGYRAVPSVGSSSFRVDIGVVDPVDPGRFMLGIMCDGDTYRDAAMARDRDRLRTQVLGNLGWKIHRIWSPDWVQRRTTEVKKLERALRKAEDVQLAAKVEKPEEAEAEMVVETGKVAEASGKGLPEVTPYRFAKLEPKFLFSRYSSEHRQRYLERYHSEVRRLLPGLVRAEGPIHVEQAFRRMNDAFRLKRATQPFREAFQEEVRRVTRGSPITMRHSFLWPGSGGTVSVRVPVEGVRESFRPIEHIPVEEMRRAMVLVAGHSLGIGEETLVNETARLLGFKRRSDNIRSILRRVCADLKRAGRITVSDDDVSLNY